MRAASHDSYSAFSSREKTGNEWSSRSKKWEQREHIVSASKFSFLYAPFKIYLEIRLTSFVHCLASSGAAFSNCFNLKLASPVSRFFFVSLTWRRCSWRFISCVRVVYVWGRLFLRQRFCWENLIREDRVIKKQLRNSIVRSIWGIWLRKTQISPW